MARKLLAVVASLVLVAGGAVPSTAAMRGHGGGGHVHGGHFHGGHFHHGGCCFGAFFGGFAFGAALAFPWGYPYAYPYSYPYPAYYGYPPYGVPAVVAQPPVSYQFAAVSQQPVVQREVAHSTGKYVLYGDGTTRPWQWVWVPAPPPSPVASRVPVIVTQPAVSHQLGAVSQQPVVQREVVHPTGKYVLYGDGMTRPWEWVWVPAPPPSPVASAWPQ